MLGNIELSPAQETILGDMTSLIVSRNFVSEPRQKVLQGRSLTPPPGVSELSQAEEDALLDQIDTNMAKALGVMPTGFGKTVVMWGLTQMLTPAILEKPGSFGFIGSVYVVTAPFRLSLQAKRAFEAYGTPNHLLMTPAEAIQRAGSGPLPAESVVFAGYDVINTDDKVVHRTTEEGTSIAGVIRQTRQAGLRIINLVDEGHVHLLGKANRRALLKHIAPDLRVTFTATPGKHALSIAPDSAMHFKVTPEQAKKEFAIVKSTYVNHELDMLQRRYFQLRDSLPADVRDALVKIDADGENRAFYIFCAVERLRILQEIALATGAFSERDLNLAAAVQLPYVFASRIDTDEDLYTRAEKESDEDDEYTLKGLREAKYVLDALFGWTTKNGMVAVLTAKEKTNHEDFSRKNAKAKVILFKVALAIGFDAPRIKTMALLREAKTPSFAIQVVGRGTRMPERKYYDSDELNTAYVYTDSEAMRSIIEQSQGEVVETTKASLTPIGKSVRDRLSNLDIENYYNKRGSQNDISNATLAFEVFRSGFEALLGKKAATEDGPLNVIRAGFSNAQRETQRQSTMKLDDIDLVGKKLERTSITLEATEGSLNKEFENLTASALNRGAVRSATHIAAGFREFAKYLGVPEKALKQLFLGSEFNKSRYEQMVTDGVTRTLGGAEASDFKVLKADTSWNVAAEHLIKGKAKRLSRYAYTLAPQKFDSDPELRVPDVVERLAEEAPVLCYYKLEGRGLESLGLRYKKAVGKAWSLTYPDWVVFFEKDDILHVVLWETKSYTENNRKRNTPEEVQFRRMAIADFMEKHGSRFLESHKVQFHGCVLNLDQHRLDAESLAGVQVVGENSSIMEWLQREGLVQF